MKTKNFYSMNNLKYYFTILAILFSLNMTTKAQSHNPDRPVIEEFTIDPKTINQTIDKLYKPLEFSIGKQHKLSKYVDNHHGFVIIPPSYYNHNGKSLGIIVMYDITERFSAHELRCPNCFYRYHRNCAMKPVTIHGFLECPSCGAQVDALFAHGSGRLTAYDMGRQGSPTSLESYCVEVNGELDDITLTIYNSPMVKKR